MIIQWFFEIQQCLVFSIGENKDNPWGVGFISDVQTNPAALYHLRMQFDLILASHNSGKMHVTTSSMSDHFTISISWYRFIHQVIKSYQVSIHFTTSFFTYIKTVSPNYNRCSNHHLRHFKAPRNLPSTIGSSKSLQVSDLVKSQSSYLKTGPPMEAPWHGRARPKNDNFTLVNTQVPPLYRGNIKGNVFSAQELRKEKLAMGSTVGFTKEIYHMELKYLVLLCMSGHHLSHSTAYGNI